MLDASAPSVPTSADPVQDRVTRHLARLEELAEIGMELARSLAREAAAQAAAAEAAVMAGRTPAKGGRDVQLCFDRLTRAVRLTVALDVRLLREGPAMALEAEAARTELRRRDEAKALAAREQRSAVHADRVRDVVERAIRTQARKDETSKEAVETLLEDLDERLEDEIEDFDFTARPIGQIVATICMDLGLSPDWGLWEDEDWAIAEAAARAPGSPYAGWVRTGASGEGVGADVAADRPREVERVLVETEP